MVKARETNLEGVLEGKKQYQVPLYQRPYSWGRPQLDQMWADLLEVVETRRSDVGATHFIGSLVLAWSPDTGAVGLQKYLVVDGQQRLTTLTILLAALRDHEVEHGDAEARERIDNQYLLNRYEPGEPLKLLPTQLDRDSYNSVVQASAQAGGEDLIGKAYRYFRAKIAAADDPEDPHDIRTIEQAVLTGLAVVAVTAEAGDNAHRIFESLNNTGLRLSQADLLKNYLFMRLGDRAEAIHRSVWLPLEKLLSPDNLELLFWLDLATVDEKATQADTYLGQQRRFERLNAAEVESEVNRIADMGQVLATILDPKREPNEAVRVRLARIGAWGSTTAYPVVMQLLLRRANGTATSEQVARALLTLEAYFVRRIVVGRATAGLNRSLLQATTVIADKPDVDTALNAYLSTGRRHFASDAQVREAAQTVAFYWQGRAAQKKLILLWLEQSYGSKEQVEPGKLTIEHVLPQTLSEDVRHEFAKGLPKDADVAYEHERIVHTLGNITLTGYNSELSNKPYSEKHGMYRDSALQLNKAIAKEDRWTTQEILARGAQLAEKIIELWPGPDERLLGETPLGGSELRTSVASVVAGIPAGKWTSYGEVAVVVGSHPVPVGSALSTYPMPNAWRVLQSGGTVSPQFRWLEPARDEDPKEYLEREGLRFDEANRADPDQFLSAAELAEIAGLDVGARDAQDPDLSPLETDQLAFWRLVRDWGQLHSSRMTTWRTPRPRSWYTMTSVGTGASVEMSTNSETGRVGVELNIHSDKELYARLHQRRAMVEAQIGEVLDWREMPENKASRIILYRDGDFRDSALAPSLAEWLVLTADRFTEVFGEML